MVPRPIARRLLRFVQSRKSRRFEGLSRDPEGAQRDTLLRILRRNAETEYGTKYNFSSIDSVADYQARVPVVTAEDLAPLVARMAAGEPGVLTGQAPHYFCQTGGTTGEPKLSPVTGDYRTEYQQTIYTWSDHLFRRFPDITEGQILYFVGSAELGRTEAGIPYGTMSGYNFRKLPGFVKSFYALPEVISEITEFEAKYYTALRVSLPQDVRMVVSITPSALLILARKLAEHGERMIESIALGTLDSTLDVSEDVRRKLEPWLRPAPGVASRLGALPLPLRPEAVWPNLRTLVCWKSGPSAPYIPELTSAYGGTPVWDAVYSATEAWMNIPVHHDVVGGPIAVGSHFFEFFSPDDTAREGPALLAHQLEEGERYSIVLTASSGMYRYDIKDVVECVGVYNATPMIAFSHKEAGFSNVVGEKLSDHHVHTAMAEASRVAELPFVFFTLAPRLASEGSPPAYVAHVEFASEPAVEAAQKFLATFEKTLQEQAWEYRGHREGEDLGPPELALLASGSAEAHRARHMRQGGNEAQMKPAHLVDTIERVAHLEVRQTLTLGNGPG